MYNPIAIFSRGSNPLARGLFFFVMGNFLVTLGMQVFFHEPFRNTDLAESAAFAPETGRARLLDSYESGRRSLAACPGESIYTKIFFEDKIKFQYPPTSLLLLVGKDLSASVLNAISWLLVAATTLAVILIFTRGCQQQWANQPASGRSPRNSLAASVFVGCLAVTFYPLVKAYTLGQIQVWINAMFALAFWSWMAGKKKCCGFLTGLMCLIKPQYGAIVIWGLFRRQWGFVLAASATGLAGLATSLALFGVDNHLDYLRVLSFMSRHGETFYPNQSMNGFLNRLLGNGNNLNWEANAFSPFHPTVYYGTLASSLFLLGLAWFWPVNRNEKGSIIDFAFMALAGTMSSPIAWEHHYGILLPIYAMLLPRVLKENKRRSVMIACLALSYMLTSHFLLATNLLAETPYNFVQSYVWIGALIVLAMLLRLRGQCALGVPADIARSESAFGDRPLAGPVRKCTAGKKHPMKSRIASALVKMFSKLWAKK